MWKNVIELGRPQVTIWCMRILCWITKATNTNSEYVILIPFQLQQCLNESACMLRYDYIAYLVGIQIYYTTVSLTSS
jgi:hypothetical protein